MHQKEIPGVRAWLLATASGFGATEGVLAFRNHCLSLRSGEGAELLGVPLGEVASVSLPRVQMGTVVRIEVESGDVYRLSFLGFEHGGVIALFGLAGLGRARREARLWKNALLANQ